MIHHFKKCASQVFKDKTLEALGLACRLGRRLTVSTGDQRPSNLHHL